MVLSYNDKNKIYDRQKNDRRIRSDLAFIPDHYRSRNICKPEKISIYFVRVGGVFCQQLIAVLIHIFALGQRPVKLRKVINHQKVGFFC